jgi:hypothetical protein
LEGVDFRKLIWEKVKIKTSCEHNKIKGGIRIET